MTTTTLLVNSVGNNTLGLFAQIGVPLLVLIFGAILTTIGLSVAKAGSAGVIRRAGKIITRR